MKALKYLIVLSFLLTKVLLASSLDDSQINNALKQAEDAYKQKNYSKAIELYQTLINSNYESFELYYNLGNAYFKNNQLGKAILCYEKAKKIKPNDPDLNHNLTIALNKTIDKISTKDNFFIEVTKNNFLNQVDTSFIAYLNIVLAVLSLLVFIGLLYNLKYRKPFLIVLIILVITNGILYSIGNASEKSRHSNDFAIVTQREVKVQNEPLQNAITKFSLHEGTKVKILQKVDNFLLIRLNNGVEGWIDEKAVEVI